MKLNEKESGVKIAGKTDNIKSNMLMVNNNNNYNSNKDNLIVSDFVTGEGTSDSAYGGGTSLQTRSSRASISDIEFSESYL